MKADLRRQLRFPPEILSTKLRPDFVIWSSRGRKVIVLELTVPWEERMEDAYGVRCQSTKSWTTRLEGVVFPSGG
jgi:hypothetical protein